MLHAYVLQYTSQCEGQTDRRQTKDWELICMSACLCTWHRKQIMSKATFQSVQTLFQNLQNCLNKSWTDTHRGWCSSPTAWKCDIIVPFWHDRRPADGQTSVQALYAASWTSIADRCSHSYIYMTWNHPNLSEVHYAAVGRAVVKQFTRTISIWFQRGYLYSYTMICKFKRNKGRSTDNIKTSPQSIKRCLYYHIPDSV